MGKEAPEWAQIGAELIEVRGRLGGPRFGRTYKIAARLGNGNLRLEGDVGQWRPSQNGEAHRVGSDTYNRVYVKLITDEARAEIEDDRKFAAALTALRKEIKRLEGLERSGDREAIIAAFSAASALESGMRVHERNAA